MRVDVGALLTALRTLLGDTAVQADDATRRLMASDLYAAGPLPLAVIRPAKVTQLAQAVAAASNAGATLVPRGGGLSYTGGYQCRTDSVLVDLSALDQIEHISAEDMYVVAQAGVTWKQLYAALAPLGLRLPFFGTFSGAGATIGGGLSHGALFFGSARYGAAADNVLGVEVVIADGTTLRTGQWALKADAEPVLRNFGPDTTGLFMHDGGAFGIKTRAAFRLIPMPAHSGYASFAFADFESAAKALSAIARAGLGEEVYLLDAGAVAAKVERGHDIAGAWRAARQVLGTASGAGAKCRALAGMLRAGRKVVPQDAFTLHMVAAGNASAAVEHDLAQAHVLAGTHGGVAIAATVPRIARADPFPNLDAVLGAGGDRWAALNVKLAHSRAAALIGAHRQLVQRHRTEMDARGVRVTYLCSALGNHSFSFEAVFHWRDVWHPLHQAKVTPEVLVGFSVPTENLPARALVATLREETCALFAAMGGASNQIGRTYPFVEVLDEAPLALLRGIKQQLDPAARMNPGVLGL
ncbi:FAD-binding oxidoreductase [Stenotrophomonas sp. SY1]|uniref:FAD-binding oxidoreductase n=1 Tax=Stenotrophomonas sp. SY1 TaxID=477235 RepID=UPI001E48D1F0|nr:FAD-binding oxidoreductase [Stenotrophomonas sp. SY1]MCD9088605.1 FAD-binding oxidoreductase [Stenotrophomonas sp. SY1]